MGYHRKQRIEELPLFALLDSQEGPSDVLPPSEPSPTAVAPVQHSSGLPGEPEGQTDGHGQNGHHPEVPPQSGETDEEAPPLNEMDPQPQAMEVRTSAKRGRPRKRPQPLVAEEQHVPPTEGKTAENGMRVLAYLKECEAASPETAILGRTIVQALGLGGTNTLRYATKWLREHGYMVVATIGSGYFIASSPTDVREYIDRNIGNRIASFVKQTQRLAAQASVVWGDPKDQIDVYLVTRVPLAQIPERLID